MAWRALRTASRFLVDRRLDLTIEGLEFLPSQGPFIIAARHYHHLYDGCVLLSVIPRPLSILVALDWVKRPLGKRVMHALCGAARWPVVQRRTPGKPVTSIAGQELRHAVRDSLALLSEGRILVVFPEAYPNIDPGFTPKVDANEFLPFEPGFVRIAAMAARHGLEIPIVPAGFRYCRGDRWQVHLAFGEPIMMQRHTAIAPARQEIETRVHRLSSPTRDIHETSPFPGA